jgi:hypothetical protein
VGVRELEANESLASVVELTQQQLADMKDSSNEPLVSNLTVENVRAIFPGGGTSPTEQVWKRIRCEATQIFVLRDGKDRPENSPVPGVFEIDLHEQDGLLIMLAWRTPKELGQQTSLIAKVMPRLVGCVRVGE